MESEGDRAERIRSEQEAAASEDLDAIRALAAAADSGIEPTEGVADSRLAEPDVTSTNDGNEPTTRMDTTEGVGGTSADAGSAGKDSAGDKSAQQASAGAKRPPESGGATHAEDEARHSHSHHHEWLAERHAHTRVGADFQVAALPTPHPHHQPTTGAGGNGANGSGGAKVDPKKEDTKGRE